jgi:UDP-N-acetylmuramate dehydrogenase
MGLFDDLRDICRPDAPLGPLTWFKLGGPAEWLIEPRDESQLSEVLHRCREADVPVRFLGLGANLLVRDEGVRGAVIRLTGEHFERMTFTDERRDSSRPVSGECRVEAGAGAHLTKFVRESVHRGLAGLEVLAGIPGTVGGGIRMNCGGRYGEIGAAVHSVRIVERGGAVRTLKHDDLRFAYRHSCLENGWVVGATFDLTPTDPSELQARYREIWKYKSEVQPPLEEKSAGCIFKNPTPEGGPGRAYDLGSRFSGRMKSPPHVAEDGDVGRPISAGRLIDEAGLKGHRCGGAEVSSRHANFIVAHPGSRAADVLALIEHVEETVYARTNVRLQREVEVW